MKKTFFLVLSVLLSTCLFAQEEAVRYFFAPTGLGDEDGTSWENAAGAEQLGSTLADAEPGTEFYLMEGAYAPDVNTNKWVIPQGVVLKGGYPTTMTGTSTSYNYMLGGQSIFSADLDGDGKGDNTSYAFVYIGDGTAEEKSDAYYSTWQKTEIWGITFRDGLRLNSKYWGNMVFVQSAQVDFHFCRFLNNDSQTNDDANGSNGALEIWGSAVRCFDCIFRDNISAKGSGAAFQVRARQSNSSAHEPEENAIAYFERCEFRNNIAYSTLTSTPENQKWGTYGGNCSIADNGGTVYLVNCLIADAKCWYRGVGVAAKVENKLRHALLFKLHNGVAELAHSVAGKAVETYVAGGLVYHEIGVDTCDGYHIAYDVEMKEVLVSATFYVESYEGAFVAAETFHYQAVGNTVADKHITVDFDKDIACKNAHPIGGTATYHLHHMHGVLDNLEHNTYAVELAFESLVGALHLLGSDKHRMGVEFGKHSGDGFLVDFLHIGHINIEIGDAVHGLPHFHKFGAVAVAFLGKAGSCGGDKQRQNKSVQFHFFLLSMVNPVIFSMA